MKEVAEFFNPSPEEEEPYSLLCAYHQRSKLKDNAKARKYTAKY